MNKWFELLIGLVLLCLAIFIAGMNIYGFGEATLLVLKGGIVWFIVMIAILLILLGISDIKDA